MKNNNWQEKKLGNIATFINGKAFKPSDWSDTGLPIIRIQNLTNSIDDIHYYNGDIEEKYRITTGDILISWSATIGVFEWLNGDAVLNQHIFKVVFDKEPIDKTFFKHLIKQKIDEMLKNVHGSTMKHITKGDFDNIDVLLPSLDEQKKIAKILDKADEIRAKKKLANDKLDEFLKSTFISMFGDKSYEKVTIGSVTDNTVQTNPSKIYEDMFYYVDIASINNEKCSIVEPKYLHVSDAPSRARKRINKDDVLVSTVRPYLRGFAIVPESLDNQIASTGFSVLRAKQEILSPLYLFSYIKSEKFISQLLPKMEGASYPAVRDEDVRNVVFKLPPIDDQNKFAQIVEHVEAQKQKNELVIEQMNNLFNSLSQRAFKGEL